MKVSPKRSVAAALTLACAAVLATGVASAQQRLGERVGAALDNTGRAIKSGVQGAFARSRAQVHTMNLLDRVYSRIHWEKSLTTSTLEIEVRADGTAILRGVVPDAKAKGVAVDLARNTVGVTQVIDQLTVGQIEVITPATVVEPAVIESVPDRPASK